ncbi:MAG: M48 family metallopeptidase [Neisseriaceae bacterium]|nr:M48 family metallopeptidase [Neisseriaceae bacterium]MBP6862542.1 M48 family metallopeptidase [Neisseriaceae bacterium]
MKKNHLTTLVAALLMAGALSGCMSTTGADLTGSNRKQLLLISSDELNAQSALQFKQLTAQARQQGMLDTTSATAKRVKATFNRLLPQTTVFRPDGHQFNWQIEVIKSNEVNAFAMPGGKMVVYTGIVSQLKLSDDELAAIIGHEMAHVLREHSREQVSQDLAKSQGLSLVGKFAGLSSSQTDLAAQVGNLAITLPFSRTMETEADRIGLEMMARAGYNPEAAVTLWQKMASLGASGGMFSTHPASEARQKELQKFIPTLMPLYEANKGKKAAPQKR